MEKEKKEKRSSEVLRVFLKRKMRKRRKRIRAKLARVVVKFEKKTQTFFRHEDFFGGGKETQFVGVERQRQKNLDDINRKCLKMKKSIYF